MSRRGGFGYDTAVAKTAKRTDYAGHTYRSKAEAQYAANLDLRKAAGEVLDWTGQYAIPCTVNGIKICTYYADFKVWLADGTTEIVDVKANSEPTPIFKLKAKLVKACHGIDIRIT